MIQKKFGLACQAEMMDLIDEFVFKSRNKGINRSSFLLTSALSFAENSSLVDKDRVFTKKFVCCPECKQEIELNGALGVCECGQKVVVALKGKEIGFDRKENING